MSEWLTTGQMIDQLKVGQVAQAYQKDEEVSMLAFEIERKAGFYDPLFNKSTNERVVMNEPFLLYKWKLLPQYVTFEEAMKALAQGSKVSIHYKDTGESDVIIQSDELGELENVTFKDLFESKWTIEQ